MSITTTGQADFVVKEEYPTENDAIKGKDPITQEAEVSDLKIENIKYKLKEVLKDE